MGKAPNCLQCEHFYVTWDPRFPRGCRMFGIKTPRIPSRVVFETTGNHCPAFTPDRRRNPSDPDGPGHLA